MSRYFPGIRASAQIVVSLEEKCHNNVCPPSFSSLLAFVSEQMLYGMEYPFGHLGSSVLSVTLPQILLGRAALLVCWRDGPGAVEALPSRTRMLADTELSDISYTIIILGILDIPQDSSAYPDKISMILGPPLCPLNEWTTPSFQLLISHLWWKCFSV